MNTDHRNKWWYWAVALVALPAYLINIGAVPFIEDESIRALVALEMCLKGDYLVPTLNDTLYFSKPPLYNWILILWYGLLGEVSEWSSRLPTVFFTMMMGGVIYWFSKPYFRQRHHAILAGLMWMTCGRVLFYDSFLGLIDTCYSVVIFAMIMAIWRFSDRRQYVWLNVVTYTLGGIAYLLKGMPIFIFIPATLAAAVVVHRRWRWLLHPSHLVGVLLMAAIIGGYYYGYSMAAPISRSLGGLAQQSTMRTPMAHGVADVMLHLISYPWEYVYHFLPWTLFLLLAIRRDVYARLRDAPFFMYCGLAFLANILVYWISPGVYPRYVLMLVPLTVLVGLYFYELEDDAPTWRIRVLSRVVMAIVVVLPLAAIGALFHPAIAEVEYGYIYTCLLVAALLICAGLYVYQQLHRPIILVLILMLLRLGLSLVVLPSRAAHAYSTICKADAQRIGTTYIDRDIQLYKGSKLDYTGSFYLTNTRKDLTTRSYDSLEADVLYLIDTSKYSVPPALTVIDSLAKREHRQTLYLATRR